MSEVPDDVRRRVADAWRDHQRKQGGLPTPHGPTTMYIDFAERITDPILDALTDEDLIAMLIARQALGAPTGHIKTANGHAPTYTIWGPLTPWEDDR